jgi:D-3-phosphoglycerate dehydrogenase / 2-oxoglutarate reductase
MKKLNIWRSNFSPYFGEHFAEMERQELSKLGNYQDKLFQSPEVLITNTNTKLEDLEQKGLLTNTKLIVHPNSGYDNFSSEIVTKLNIPIILGNAIRQEAVVDYCLSCMFEDSQKVPFRSIWADKRQWKRSLLYKKSALVIGNGHVGSSLVKKITPLLEKIYVHDPYLEQFALGQKSNADIIFICASLSDSSTNLINKNFLNQLKKNVTIINPARGQIINMDDLSSFLYTNPNANAYIDVFPVEPYPIEQWQDRKNLKASCHVAGVFDNIDKEIIKFEKLTISDFREMSREQFILKYKKQDLQQKEFTK